MLRERNQSDALQAVATMQEGDVITVDEELALSAAQFSHEMKLPMADSIIYSVARKKEAKIWTQDSDFKDLTLCRIHQKVELFYAFTCCSWYCLGVMPVSSLNSFMKWLRLEYPS